jgi:hypothetical protein
MSEFFPIEMLSIKPGDWLWFVIPGKNTRIGDIIIPVQVLAISDVYSHPNYDGGSSSLWAYHEINPLNDYVSVPSCQDTDKYEWQKESISWLKEIGAKQVNRFVWIDEPIGHALQTSGDAGDGLFMTLAEAQANAIPSRKKHLKRRLNKFRSRNKHYKSPNPKKKIYVSNSTNSYV